VDTGFGGPLSTCVQRMNPLLKLAEQWRSQAEMLRRYGDERGATVCELHAGQLEAAWNDWQSEELRIAEAALESGYSEEHLRRRVRDGSIPNAGKPNAPRIRRGDVPRKPGQRDGRKGVQPVDCKEQIARSVADSTEGARDG